MTALGPDFRHADRLADQIAKAKMRRVRTPEGAKKYDQPIGTIITPAMIRRAARLAGKAAGVGGDGHGGGGGGGGGKAPVKQAARRADAPDAPKSRLGATNRFNPKALPDDPVARKRTYEGAIRAARGDDQSLVKIILRLENDSILPDEDYDNLLDQIEVARKLPPAKKAAKAPGKKAPAKAARAPQQPAGGGGAPKAKPAKKAAQAAAQPAQGTGPNTRAARVRQEAARRAAEKRAAAKKQAAKKPATPLTPATIDRPDAQDIRRREQAQAAVNDYGKRLGAAQDQKDVREIMAAVVKDPLLNQKMVDLLAAQAKRRMESIDRKAQAKPGLRQRVRSMIGQSRKKPQQTNGLTDLDRQRVQGMKTGDRVKVVDSENARSARVKGVRGSREVLIEDRAGRRKQVRGRNVGVLNRFESIQQAVESYKQGIAGARNDRDLDIQVNRIKVDHRLSQSERNLLYDEAHKQRKKIAQNQQLVTAQNQAQRQPRPKAKEGGRERKWMDAVNDAPDERALIDVMMNVQQDQNMSPSAVNRVLDAIGDKHQDLVGGGSAQTPADLTGKFEAKKRDAVMQEKPKPSSPPKRTWTDPKDSPAGKELAAGKDIDKVSNPEGLVEYIEANPNRYQITYIDEGQVSKVFEVEDLATGRMYFFKTANNGYDKKGNPGGAGMWADGMNEVVAAKLGRAAFADLFPNVEYASPPVGELQPRIRMDHIREFVPGAQRVQTSAKNRYFDNRIGKGLKDPRQALAIHIFDYLIDQTDRHPGNYGVVKTAKGDVLVPLDNGAAFHAYNGYMHDHGVIPDDVVFAPETVSYKRWAEVFGKGKDNRAGMAKAKFMMDEARGGYREQGWGDGKMRHDAEMIIDQFKKVDIDSLFADLAKRFPEMDEYERNAMEGARLIWSERLNKITADDVVRMIR